LFEGGVHINRDRLSDSVTFRLTFAEREELEEIAAKKRASLSETARGYVITGMGHEMLMAEKKII
jgi:hypothetical protein